MKLIKLIMPSQGDMTIVNQEGGVIWLKPTYFGGECAGPVVQFVDAPETAGPLVADKESGSIRTGIVEASYRIKIKKDNELRLAKAD